MIAIYARVSTEEQATKGYSIGNQIDECIKKSGTEEVLKYVDEGISGEVIDRPSLTRLREDVSKGLVDEIICYDPDRLSRKLMHQLILDDEFRKKGVGMKFVNGDYAQTPEGQLFFSMRGAISEFEKEKIKQRTKGGKIKKAKNGKVIGNYGLYGYNYDKSKETYVINEEQAKVVKMIFDYFTEPTSPFRGMNGIARHLTDMGIPTARNSGVWHRNVVRQILLNESYTGRHPHNKTNSEGDYVRKQSGLKTQQTVRPKDEWIYVSIPRIIEETQYEIAQELISQSRRRFAKESLNTYLLSGLVKCKDCSNTMTGRKTSWWNEKITIYSDTKSSTGTKNKGCGNYIKTGELDEVVWDHVADLLNNPHKIMEYKESDKMENFFEQEKGQISKEIEKIKKGRQRLLSLVALSDDLNLNEIKVQLEELQTKEKSLQEQYNQIEKEIKGNKDKEANTEMIQMAIKLYLSHKDKELSFEEKKQIIRTMVKQIYVSKDHQEVDIHLF